jgi:hypothetical protein
MKTKNQIVEILNKYNLLIDENTGQCAISDSDFDRIADEILQPETKELTAEDICRCTGKISLTFENNIIYCDKCRKRFIP